MTTAIRVRLTPALKLPPLTAGPVVPALEANGPFACLGSMPTSDALPVSVTPSATSMFGPRGACMLGPGGPLWVCDTGHHRLLGWDRLPRRDGEPADWLIGQPDFSREGRNAKGVPGAATLNVPTGITPCGEGIAVADAWNHRVLIWHHPPSSQNEPADLVLGQSDFASVSANRGSTEAKGDTLYWPYGVHWDGTRLWVADSGNRRVLMWNGIPTGNGQPANLVLGQRDFNRRDENGGGEPNARTMRWPHAIASWGTGLCIADAGDNRIMVWDQLPEVNNQPCDALLGQAGFNLVDHNQSLYWPNAASLNMPYGAAVAGRWLIVADTANSRLIAWKGGAITTGMQALAVTGQVDFEAKGDNRWKSVASDSLCWPYAVSHCAGIVAVSDSGNNRVLLWRVSEELGA